MISLSATFWKNLQQIAAWCWWEMKKIIALIIENSTPHNNFPWLKNIKVYYFSPNCTSILQLLDLEIIKCFKGYCWKRFVQNVIYKLMEDSKSVVCCENFMWLSLKKLEFSKCIYNPNPELHSLQKNILKVNEHLNIDVTEIIEEECLGTLWATISAYQSSSNLFFLFNVEEFLNSDNDVLMFSGTSDEEVITIFFRSLQYCYRQVSVYNVFR